MLAFRPCLWLVAVLLVRLSAAGQGYTDVALDAGIFFQYGTVVDYGAGVCFHDFDNDGDDDLSLCQLQAPAEFYENVDGEFELMPFIPEAHSAKSMQWVDFDNDGDADLFITKPYDSPVLLERVGPWSFEDISLWAGINMPPANTFGSNWGDYNNDQLLDVYICNYNADGITNYLYKNNGNGSFSDVTEETNAGGGSHHSFQATFLDYDRDGWQDLFVINDRLTSRNYMLKNNEGVFQDVTLEAMGYHYIFSMSNSVADYDNDADQDIFISNNPEGHLLHRNEGDGTFTEVASEAGIATHDHCWAGQWIDFNLDGHQDLHICCSPFWSEPGQNKFYRNTEDGSFVYDLSPGFEGDEAWSHSSAVADYNDDGIFDLFVMNSEPDVSSLWASSGSQSSYLKVSLEGIESNKDAIGSWIEIWVEGEYQMRYTFCGEGYMSQNSDAEIFGLSNHDSVDSLKVTWPNGNEEMYYNLDVNQHLELLEGGTAHFSLGTDLDMYLCAGDSIAISAPEFASYLWSTGDTSQTLIITSPGEYEVRAWDGFGMELQSDTVSVSLFTQTMINASVISNVCYGDSLASIELENISGTGLITCEWLLGESGPELANLAQGSYSFTWIDENGCATPGTVDVQDPPPIEVSLTTHHISCFGEHDGAVEVDASGGTGELSTSWGENDPPQNLGPGPIEVTVTDDNGCIVQAIANIEEPDQLELDIEQTEIVQDESWLLEAVGTGGTFPYQYYWSNGGTDESIEAGPGVHSVWIYDDNGCSSFGASETLGTGINDIQEGLLFNLYPNPFENAIHIHARSPIQSIRILDTTGRLVLKENFNSGNLVNFNTSSLSRGQYLCIVQLENKSVSKVIIKSSE